MSFPENVFCDVELKELSVLTPEAIHTGTSGHVDRCLGGPTPGLASLERPQQVPQR